MSERIDPVDTIRAALEVLKTPGTDAMALAAGMLTAAVAILVAQSGVDVELVLAGLAHDYALARDQLDGTPS